MSRLPHLSCLCAGRYLRSAGWVLPRFAAVWEADEVSDRRETLLEMAQRHVREDEERLARQAAIVDKLESQQPPRGRDRECARQSRSCRPPLR